MKILFTGASSFTGYWFVRTLVASGHEVCCPLSGGLDRYTDIRRTRVEKLGALCQLVPDAPFGTENFFKLAGTGKFDLLCHHAADVTNYKSPDFDPLAALQNNALNLRRLLAALKPAGLQGLVLTGSVFENDEGKGNEPLRAFSPYGLSKGLTYQVFRYYCQEAGVPLGKFVIPNPFGPYEEPRFTAFLMKNWRADKPVEVKTPDYLRDNIHVDLLAAVYAGFCTKIVDAKTPLVKFNPSAYAEKQGEFARRVQREVKLRTGWACALNLAAQVDFSEPLERINTEPAAKLAPDWKESRAWDGFVEFYSQ